MFSAAANIAITRNVLAVCSLMVKAAGVAMLHDSCLATALTTGRIYSTAIS
jgi:hypothetical protein